MRQWLAALLLLLPLTVRAEDALEQSVRALDQNDVVEAERTLSQLPVEDQQLPEPLFQRGLIHFYNGQYAEGAREMEGAIAAAPRSPQLAEWRRLLAWASAARDITADFEHASSPDGRYQIAYPKGVDAVLVPYALEALRSADQALETQLGIHLPAPIRLEVYPSARTLAEVSSLSLEHIQTTGTVALCKWNRLMVASPRSLLYGYPWLDTINHELVHLALSYASKNHAPVWFHEGLAKLFERTWRGLSPGAYLAPPTASLLLKAARDKKLIAFERMHPSIAMLPSQEDAALAFAQVVTFLERFRERFGDAGLTRTIQLLASGLDVRFALAKVASVSFPELEAQWRADLSERQNPEPPVAGPPGKELKLRFVENGAADESLDVSEGRARKHLRVGDLLWSRHRTLAAAREYETAQRLSPTDPILASRVARASLAANDAARALNALDLALREHPTHEPLQALRGTALIALSRAPEAHDPLVEAIRLNPFDPAPHCQLARISDGSDGQARERNACKLLSGQ